MRTATGTSLSFTRPAPKAALVPAGEDPVVSEPMPG
jgi:hypothetical protein